MKLSSLLLLVFFAAQPRLLLIVRRLVLTTLLFPCHLKTSQSVMASMKMVSVSPIN